MYMALMVIQMRIHMFVDQAATLTTLPVSLVETVSAEAVRISYKNI